MIILNLGLLAWLLLVTPIVEVGTGSNAGDRFRELIKQGVVDTDRLAEFQKMNPKELPTTNPKVVGRWMTRQNTFAELLVLPAGLLLAVNTLHLIANLKKKRNVESKDRQVFSESAPSASSEKPSS